MPDETKPLAALMGEFEKPSAPIDLEAVGLEYLRKAKIETAIARWKANCPPEMIETDWRNPKLQANAARCVEIREWKASKRGILASGPSGRGKTRSMWALMKRLAEEGRDIRYYTAAQWFSQLQGQTVYGREEQLAWVQAVARAPIVFIDDLGQEAVSKLKEDWAQAWLFQFLDLRLGNGLPLFITTNQTAKEIAGVSEEPNGNTRGNPLVRRLLDLCEPVKFLP